MYLSKTSPIQCSSCLLNASKRSDCRSMSRKNSFLANDVTLVTSYGYCQSLKINDIRETYVRRLSYDL